MFAEEIWSKRPQHRRSQGEGGFDDLLSLDDVDLVVSSMGVRLPAFRLVKDGETLPAGRYTKTTRTGSQEAKGVIDSMAVFAEFSDGATIVFQGMHRYWSPLARYCRSLEIALGHPVQANAYVTPPGAQGFAAHEDEHDVFVLQTHGAKKWMVHERHDLPPAGPPLIDALLAPGDSLYIPEGFPHSATTEEQASLHVTIGILAITWADALKEILKGLESDPALRQPLPLRFSTEDGTLTDEIRSRLAEIGASVTATDPALLARRLRRSLLTTRQPVLRGHIHRLLTLDQVSDVSMVRRRDESMCVLEVIDGELSVLLGDRELRMPAWVEPAMSVVASGDVVPVADLPGLDKAGREVLVRRLIREGLLEVVG